MDCNDVIKSPLADRLIWWSELIIDFVVAIIRGIPILISNVFEFFYVKKFKDVRGKVALVTGTARGLGREIAVELARHGCSVICVDILTKENEITEAEIVTMGKKATAFTCDITNRDKVMQLAESVGPIDILVNNAGIIFIDPLLETPANVVQKVIDLNITSLFWMIQAFLPGMMKRKHGRIVSISSCGGLTGLSNGTLYCSTKHAVVGLMKSLSEELRENSHHTIRLSCVCPYFVNTVEDIKTRITLRVPALETDEAARLIVKGIRQELTIFTVPNYLLYLIGLQSILPTEVQQLMRDVFYVKIEPRNSPAQISKKIHQIQNKEE